MIALPPPVASTHGIVLPSRYTIRPINSAVSDWAKALLVQGLMLRPSIWKQLIREPRTASALQAFTFLDGNYSHSLGSGMSYGIFDSEYEFTRPESVAMGGRVYWDELDPTDPDFERNGEEAMEARMDFPLVCVAASCDAIEQKSEEVKRSISEMMPLHDKLYKEIFSQDPRPIESWAPKKKGEVWSRSGCVTKPGYEGRGLMSALNHFVMLEAKSRGYRGIVVGTGNQSIIRNWMKAPQGCKSSIVAAVNIWDLEVEDDEGNKVRPYLNSDMTKEGCLIWCDLTA